MNGFSPHPLFIFREVRIRWALLALVLGAVGGHAGSPGASFLKPNPSVRSQGLGDVSLGGEGAQAVGLNPARVAPISAKAEMDTSFFRTWEDSNNARVSYARNLDHRRAWGISVAVAHSGSSESTDIYGQPTGQTPSSQNAVLTAALARELKKGVRLGAAGRVFQSSLANKKSNCGWSVDVGASGQLDPFMLSVSVHQLGPGIRYVSQRDPLPSSLNIGLVWNTGPVSWLGGYDTGLNWEETTGSLAMEYQLKIIALRAGIKNRLGGKEDFAQASASGVDGLLDNTTLGFGLALPGNLKLDYAFSQKSADWGPTHSVAMTWSWGIRPVPKPKKKWTQPTPAKPAFPVKPPASPRQKLKK